MKQSTKKKRLLADLVLRQREARHEASLLGRDYAELQERKNQANAQVTRIYTNLLVTRSGSQDEAGHSHEWPTATSYLQ
jgi:hypothetical protein